ncbi:hypothetical protein TNCV_3951011 [Trichonephila clavipes]|nr:hypothetical protein TNCV_3951011 [Trichonephila clavipes]
MLVQSNIDSVRGLTYIWQESWSQQLDNKLHSVKPVIGAWSGMPMRRTDVKLTRLRIGHTSLHTPAFVVWRTCS